MKKIVTIWRSYGRYHLARVNALQKVFKDVEIICFSHCQKDMDYECFIQTTSNHRVLLDLKLTELRFRSSFLATIPTLRFENPNFIRTAGYKRPETLVRVLCPRLSQAIELLMTTRQADQLLDS